MLIYAHIRHLNLSVKELTIIQYRMKKFLIFKSIDNFVSRRLLKYAL